MTRPAAQGRQRPETAQNKMSLTSALRPLAFRFPTLYCTNQRVAGMWLEVGFQPRNANSQNILPPALPEVICFRTYEYSPSVAIYKLTYRLLHHPETATIAQTIRFRANADQAPVANFGEK